MMEAHKAWTPRQIAEEMSVHQIIALGAPVGKISREQAMDVINARRAKKGMEPISYLP